MKASKNIWHWFQALSWSHDSDSDIRFTTKLLKPIIQKMKISIQTSLTPVKHLAQVSELYLLNYFLTSFQTILCKKTPKWQSWWKSKHQTYQKKMLLRHYIHSKPVMVVFIKKLSTVKLRAVDWSTIQFWSLLAKGHSTEASNFPFINSLKTLRCATYRDSLLTEIVQEIFLCALYIMDMCTATL